MELAENWQDVSPERAWVGGVTAAIVALLGGSLLAPRAVYDGFLWHYFWGPVYADAHGATCAVKSGASVELLNSNQACASAAGIVAFPGYTVVSEVGYAVTLVVALVGVVFLLQRLDVGSERRLLYSLVPFVLFGGALRVVEDANDAGVSEGLGAALSYPWNALIISPVIYFTVFAITLATVVLGVVLAREGYVESYDQPVATVGTGVLVVTLGYLFFGAPAVVQGETYPQVLAVVLVGTTVVTAVVWYAIERFAPELNRGTRLIGVVVLWAHSLDGVANVVALDWATALGLPFNLGGKHPVNRAIVDITGNVFPASVTALTGTAWPFLLLKVGAALFVIWIFDEQIFEESPRYAILLLVAIVAVGMGPGTRDVLRVTLGV